MPKQSASELISLADHHFKNHWVVMSLWQTLAEHFYPERADFTVTRNVGQELSDNLVDSYPILVRRDLGNSFSAMLRDGEWFKVTVDDDPDHDGKLYLEWASKRMLKLINDRGANFVRSTKEGDHDYATFGQTVLSVEMNRIRTGLLYRCWHLRDVCWWDGVDGQVEGVVRKWKPTYRQMVDYFGDKCHRDILDNVYKMPFKECDVKHIFIPAVMYGEERYIGKYKYVSLFVDVAHQTVIEEVPSNHMMYIIPRFQTIAGSPYAYSPATVVGLPDARSLQAMTHTLLEAGERYARPPIIATAKVIRGDVDLRPDGITWVDDEYDERLGASLRTLAQDRGGWPIGKEMRQGIVSVLHSAFYQDKLNMPDKTNMTAYEVSEWMKQYRRQNLPLFAPLEAEYNGRICESSFELLMSNGLLGSPYDIPESLRGRDVQFKFQSPLSESDEQKKATQFSQVAGLLAEAANFDPQVVGNVNFDEAFRDAVEGTGSPIKWLHSLESVMEQREASAQQQSQVQQLQMTDAAAQVATNVKAAVA
jgi:hypothetical protein